MEEKIIDEKQIFEELEKNFKEYLGYGGVEIMQIYKKDFEEIKRKYCELDWTGY